MIIDDITMCESICIHFHISLVVLMEQIRNMDETPTTITQQTYNIYNVQVLTFFFQNLLLFVVKNSVVINAK